MDNNNVRVVPSNDLDLQLMITNPEWGREISPELKVKLEKIGAVKRDKEGRLIVSTASMWDLLSYYTRDIRLGNLSVLTGELQYCQEWLDFAGDCLRIGLPKSFLTALTRVITILELSQSKGGFLRKRQQTITTEQYQEYNEPKRSSFWGKNSKKEER